MPCLFQSQGKLKLFFIPHGTLVVSAVSLELTVVPFFLSRRAEPSASATEKDKKKISRSVACSEAMKRRCVVVHCS